MLFEATGPALTAAPNPFSGHLALTMQATTATATTLTLTDALGRVVLTQAIAAPAGTTQLELPGLAHLPAGLYVLRLTLDDQPQTLKVVKQ